MSLSCVWDQFDAYVFDIDGTLLNCSDAVHYFAFCDVLSSVAGRPLNLDGVTAHGNTDLGILRDAFALAGVCPDEWRRRLPALCDVMCRNVEERRSELRANPLPQVREVLVHLRERGALLSVATGNMERIGRQKLAAAGLLDFFDLGTWSDAFEYRNDVFRNAIAQIKCHARFKSRADASSGISILFFGDTPADIAAARNNDVPLVALATGVYSHEQLAAERPSLCIHSFAELIEQTRSTTCSNSCAR